MIMTMKWKTLDYDAMNNVGLWMWWTTHGCGYWIPKSWPKERMRYVNSGSNHSRMSKDDEQLKVVMKWTTLGYNEMNNTGL